MSDWNDKVDLREGVGTVQAWAHRKDEEGVDIEPALLEVWGAWHQNDDREMVVLQVGGERFVLTKHQAVALGRLLLQAASG